MTTARVFSRADLSTRVRDLLLRYRALRERVDPILIDFAARNSFLYQSRLKTEQSAIEKLETGRFKTAMLDDYYAATLVVTTAGDVQTCVDSLPSSIEVAESRDLTTQQSPPERFSFNDRVLTCRLIPGGSPGGPNTIFELGFEVQVRTLSMHAWAQATHDVIYKGPDVAWRRLRLAAQLRALAEQADLLYSNLDQAVPMVSGGRWDPGERRQRVASAVQAWRDTGLVPPEAEPESVRRFAETAVAVAEGIRLDPDEVAEAVRAWLGGHSYPVSISLYQLWVGIAIAMLPGAQLARRVSGLRGQLLLISTELEHVFPAVTRVPNPRRVGLE